MSKAEAQDELESQFILRLPEEPANALREMIRSGAASLEDRFSIRLENDCRHGQVRVDNSLLQAQVVDLPTIVESLKTVDNMNFIKTADICQMMICKEEDDSVSSDEAAAAPKKKDPYEVDEKYLWPHGITPPLKNVRKRRFRKVAKKKQRSVTNEVEKEVARLLIADNDAECVRWETISDDDQKPSLSFGTIEDIPGTSGEANLFDGFCELDLAEQLFGGALSDFGDEETDININEELLNSVDDGQISVSKPPRMGEQQEDNDNTPEDAITVNDATGEEASAVVTEVSKPLEVSDNAENKPTAPSNGIVLARLEQVRRELAEIKDRRASLMATFAGTENEPLRKRLQDLLDSLLQMQHNKVLQFLELSELLG